MTDSPGEPDWSLLPHDPVRFFGLAEGFDRRELKRSYNQLIRRFKPEKHPQEFQRIRAAHEQLDSGIRYGLGVQFSADSPANTVGPTMLRTAAPGEMLHRRSHRPQNLLPPRGHCTNAWRAKASQGYIASWPQRPQRRRSTTTRSR